MAMCDLWELTDVAMAGASAPRLADVSVRLRPGHTAILGWSGAGKSSLLNLLVGYERPDRGQIRRNLAFRDGRLPLYWAPQQGGLWPHVSAREHLRLVAHDAGEVESLLASFGLEGVADRAPDRLSVGEGSRLSVARALASRASVLVLDEPLAHVDQARIDEFWVAVMTYAQRYGQSVVYATHLPALVLGWADRVLFLHEGILQYEGPVDVLYWSPPDAHLAWCLGPANWFTPDDAQRWLHGSPPEARCLRPHCLRLESAPGSGVEVCATRFMGAWEATTLRLVSSGEVRCFYHAVPGTAPVAGQSVRLVPAPIDHARFEAMS
jgi:ABC-type nitrate/sulfonate/bicarbonate transport system ATPase subunit